MREIKLMSYRVDCAGCPTIFSVWDDIGNEYTFYYRGGFMEISIDTTDELLYRAKFGGALDGVCELSDFIQQAETVGIVFDASEMEVKHGEKNFSLSVL